MSPRPLPVATPPANALILRYTARHCIFCLTNIEFHVTLLFMVKRHLMQYGNTILQRGYCISCQATAIILKDVLQCCDRVVADNDKPKPLYLATPARLRRKKPSSKQRSHILAIQENKCKYCSHTFGSYVLKNNKVTALRVVWDHHIPYSYGANNNKENFVAACQICNGLKSNKIFDSLEQLVDYIKRKWESKNITYLA